jgi:DNA-binding response OmpR family regulator
MARLNDRTVLVVDDEPDLREMVAFEFRLLGSKVFSADNGLSALGILESEGVDAVVTDIRMSGCDGIELLNSLRERSPVNPVVILITAYDSDLSPCEAYRMGAEGIFPKPFSLKDLVTNVERALTPLEERWSTPPSVRPGRVIECRWQNYETACSQRGIALGRGGMALSVGARGISPGEAAWFDVRLATGPLQAIEGSGTVRWVSQGPDASAIHCGIEFEYLTDACRRIIIDGQTAALRKPFIPNL